MREQLIKNCEILPIEFVVRNIAAGTLSSRLGIAEGTMLKRPIIEYYYKNPSNIRNHGNENFLLSKKSLLNSSIAAKTFINLIFWR